MSQKLFGTNCGNCTFFGAKLYQKVELNEQGGIVMDNVTDLQAAEDNDLITLPGKDASMSGTHECNNSAVDQPVNDRMCCALWDNPDARREWEQ